MSKFRKQIDEIVPLENAFWAKASGLAGYFTPHYRGPRLAYTRNRLWQGFMNVETENRITRKAHGRFHDGEPLNHELQYLWKDRDASGKSYDIYLGKISRSPVIKSNITGRYFSLPWPKIIKLAVEGGVDD